VQQAASELEKTGRDARGQRARRNRGVTRVQIEKPKFNIQDYFWTGTLGLVALIGQATVVLFLTFFLLASGDTFRRKMVKIAGPTFTEKRLTIQALDEITAQIQRYLLVQVFTSVLVGIATWLCFVWIGVQQAAVWGIVAGRAELHPVRRLDRLHGRLGRGRPDAVRQHRIGADDRRRVAGAAHHLGLRADAVADQPDQPDERRHGVRRRARCSAGCGASGACCSGCRS
jgi:hypothetical protein